MSKVEVRRAGEHTDYAIYVDGVMWAKVTSPEKTGGKGRNAWCGPDWDAARKRAEAIVAGLQLVLMTDGERQS